MKKVIKEKGINRVVVASCSPRTHEPLFQQTIREAGLNKYLFEMANIRDQNTWVHQGDQEAGHGQGQRSGRMAVARVSLLDPLQQVSLGLNKAAPGHRWRSGRHDCRLESGPAGVLRGTWWKRRTVWAGNALKFGHTWKGEDIGIFIQDDGSVLSHPRIQVHFKTRKKNILGFIGNFDHRSEPYR